ncbi:beta-glucosidase [Thalassotalea sp. LPB0316]|uniref:GH1 family beta-glucosidase n=1 Tax=Thalassotalea sp. LPB0316 TaxID=2769490 RepID=UPI001866B9D9|nr:GH1 family beta-glucosidase [Thalassotalea sp. LPB0316]QOL24556.1 beta-glucosidase [Thalassotalea sp. LPB0316]
MAQYTLPQGSKMLAKQFTYGVATASFQIEGGVEHRLPCIWDTFCATPGKVADGSNGDIACDHFSLWQQDIELIASLGVDAYRLSLSWPRLITRDGELNQAGVDFYINILDALNARNIKPYVTLYHWDLPQHHEDNGGWLNRDTAYAFAHYVDLVTKAFGDRVYSYATLNEPFCSSYLGYEVGIHAPGKVGKEYGRKAAHHLLLAHGLAMQVLKRNAPHAKNGIVLNFTPCYSATDKQADIDATHFADDYFNQWYIKPIFDKCYPEIINQLPQAHQPDIHDGDMEIIGQNIDFLGINFYTRAIYRAHNEEIFEQLPPPAPLTDIGWEIYPQAFTNLLTDLDQRYTLPPIFITENGAAMADVIERGVVNDQDRVDYYQAHLNAVNDAIEQGVDIQGYFAWSLMDNFEWAEGYLKRFGIVYVDYQSQQRTIKQSGLAYRDLITSRH